MVFCRGCGQQIHETAINCPLCGSFQYLTHKRKIDQKINYKSNEEKPNHLNPGIESIKVILNAIYKHKVTILTSFLLYISFFKTIQALITLTEPYSSLIIIGFAIYIHRNFFKESLPKTLKKFFIYIIPIITITSLESSKGNITYNIAYILEKFNIDAQSTYEISYEHNNYDSLRKLALMEVPYYQYRYAELLYYQNTGTLDKDISLVDLNMSLNLFKKIKDDFPVTEYIDKINSIIDNKKNLILTQEISTPIDRHQNLLKAAENNDLTAIKQLANNYINGLDVDKNIVLASIWLKKAYDLGDIASSNELLKISEPLKNLTSTSDFFNLAKSMGDSSPNGSEMQIKWYCKIIDSNFSTQEDYENYRKKLLTINLSLGNTYNTELTWLCSYPSTN